MTKLEQEVAKEAARALLEVCGGEWLPVLDGKEHRIEALGDGTIQVTDGDGLTAEYSVKVTVELVQTGGAAG
jgi:hypothetical protein